jgi:hypothetical protein
MAKQKSDTFQLLSNEWAVPYWLLGIGALLLGMLSYLVQLYAPTQTGLFNNILFLVLMVLLSIFYKKLYITKVEVRLTPESMEVRYLKLVLPTSKSFALEEVTGLGVERTEAIKGLVSVPEKNWILIKLGKKKIYFYEQDGQNNVKGLLNLLRNSCSDAERLENILK